MARAQAREDRTMLRFQAFRLFLVLAALLAPGCGDSTPKPIEGGDETDSGTGEPPSDEPSAGPDVAPFEPITLRPLPADVLARRAICYSGYRREQSPEIMAYPSEAQIREDLQILERGKLNFIRLFDSGTHAERVLNVIATDKLDFKVMLGIWISGAKAKFDAQNQLDIARGVALANKYKDIVVAVSVGNETLDDWSGVKTSAADLVSYMLEVREKVTQPITTDDSWLPFMLGVDGKTDYKNVVHVARASDFLSLHTYAFADAFWGSWDYKQESVPEAERAQAMMDAAFAYTKVAIGAVRAKMAEHGVNIPILIGEAGWKDQTKFSPANASDAPEDAIEAYFAHPINQKIFYDDLVSWVYGEGKDADSPVAAFYFEAFDEPWKGAWGDDGWGLFNVDRQAKFLMWDAFPDLKPKDAKAPEATDAVYYKPSK
jgi:exo-beta-1,3-glucanase (GH17 family)